jgi:serine phosphatase RsbU (regulator of sigma subunit)
MSFTKKLFLLLFFIFSLHQLAAQKSYVDSLKKCFWTNPNIKEKVNAAIYLSGNYGGKSHFDSAFHYIDIAIPLAQNDSLQRELASLYSNKSIIYIFQGHNNSIALNSIMKAIKISEKIKDSSSLADNYNVIGIIYLNIKYYEKAREYWLKGLEINLLTKNELNCIDSYGNLGNVNAELHHYDSSLYYFNKSLLLTKKYKNLNREVLTLMNIGDVYIRTKKFSKAFDYTQQSLDLEKKLGAEMSNPKLYSNLGLIYTGLKQYELAHTNYNKSLLIESRTKNADDYRQIYDGLSKLFAAENNFSKAYEYHQLFSNYNDSVYNNENIQALSDIKAKYEIDKKEGEFKIQTEKERLKTEAEHRKQKLIEIALLIGFSMIATVAFFIFRSYRIKKKANDVITKQKDEIETNKTKLEIAYTEIKDSINYAKSIQQASLPDIEKLKANFPDFSFVYRPKNVVSGDFYYFNEVIENNERSFILAVCDCTGHGVPGAFMSLIGIEQLNKIIDERHIYKPSLILDALHTGVREALKQESNESRDGMDVILCKITYNNDDVHIEYAGANRPMWILKKNSDAYTFQEIKADKRAIGGLEISTKQNFTNQCITLQKGDIIYCSTDGYADQFGGPNEKKLMVKNFQSLLLEIANRPMSAQEKNIIDRYETWKGELEQIDDVCVIGIRL